MSKIDENLFERTNAQRAAYGDCPKCSAALQIKHKGKSSFLGCSNYPTCDFVEPLNNDAVTQLKVIDDSQCPHCHSLLAVKNGRYGMFIGCTNFPTCDYISSKKSNQENSDYEPVHCPNCKTGKLQKKQNKFGKFFFACDNYPKCRFVVNEEPVEQVCALCGFAIAIRDPETGDLTCANKRCQ